MCVSSRRDHFASSTAKCGWFLTRFPKKHFHLSLFQKTEESSLSEVHAGFFFKTDQFRPQLETAHGLARTADERELERDALALSTRAAHSAALFPERPFRVQFLNGGKCRAYFCTAKPLFRESAQRRDRVSLSLSREREALENDHCSGNAARR